MDDLAHLAGLLKQRNEIDRLIAALIGRPALAGHVGEFIAARIFDIALHPGATHKGSDGRFRSGPLAGRTVNVKFYGKREGLLDMHPDLDCDYYLVLTGPTAAALSSRGTSRPAVIEGVYLFETCRLIDEQRARGVQIGVASSLTRAQWDAAELFPRQANRELVLTEEQRRMLALFRNDA